MGTNHPGVKQSLFFLFLLIMIVVLTGVTPKMVSSVFFGSHSEKAPSDLPTPPSAASKR